MPDRSLRPLGYAVATAALSTGLLVVAVKAGWLGADVGRGANFCEAARAGWVKQPANTFSNLGFVVAGLVIAWHAGRTRLGGLATPYACVVVLLGPASAAMHATQSELGGQLDLLSMYLVAAFAAAYALVRWHGRERMFFWQLFLLFVAGCELVGLPGDGAPVVQQWGNVAFAELRLLVGQVLGQRRPEPVDRAAEGRQPVGCGHHRDERAVDVLERAVDDVVLLLQPVQDGTEGRLALPQVREDRAVLDRVVGRDQAAVGLAVGAQCPLVLAHRQLVDDAPGPARVERAGLDLGDEVEQLAELGAQVVVHVDQVPAHPGHLGLGLGAWRDGCAGAGRRHELAYGGRHLGAEAPDRRGVVGADDERRDAVGQREL